MRILTSCVV